LTDSMIEIAKLLGTLSVAVMSMSVVTYALAVPRLQTALSLGIKRSKDEKDKLTKRIKEENLTIDQIDDQLKALKKELGEIEGIVRRLSWSKVVVIPSVLSAIALGLGATTIGFAALAEVQELIVLLVAAGFLLVGFVHLLMSLRMIEQTAIRPEMRLES
jgi:hypothetical protein